MSVRGRGTLEVRSGPNPFFQTTSHDIGLTTDNANLEWTTKGGEAPPMNLKPYNRDGNFSFLYTRESDMIGAKVGKPQKTEIRMLSRSEFLKQRREKALENGECFQTQEVVASKPTANDLLRTYQHASKEEDPRYTTAGVRN
jgi:hypothetical protein